MKEQIEIKNPHTKKELELLVSGDIVDVDFGNTLRRSKIGKLAMVEGHGHFNGHIGFIGKYDLEKIFYITIRKDYLDFTYTGIGIKTHMGFYRIIIEENQKITFLHKKLDYNKLKLKLEKGGIWEEIKK